MKNKLLDLIRNNEKWVTIKYPDDLHKKIMNNIKKEILIKNNKVFNILFIKKLLKFKNIFISSFIFLLIITIVIVTYSNNNYMKFIYPYDGEEKVELIGSFNNYEKKILMKFNSKKKIWEAKVKIYKKGIYEYQFIVNDKFFLVGNSDIKFEDNYGKIKHILFYLWK